MNEISTGVSEVSRINQAEMQFSQENSEKLALNSLIEQILNLPNSPEAIDNFIQQRKESLGKNPIRTLEKENLFFNPIVSGFFYKEMAIQLL